MTNQTISSNATASTFRLTAHAELRRQQRGISHEHLSLVLSYGQTYPAARGLKSIQLLRNQIAQIHADGFGISCIEKATRIVCILKHGVIVTMYWCDETGRKDMRRKDTLPPVRRFQAARRRRSYIH